MSFAPSSSSLTLENCLDHWVNQVEIHFVGSVLSSHELSDYFSAVFFYLLIKQRRQNVSVFLPCLKDRLQCRLLLLLDMRAVLCCRNQFSIAFIPIYMGGLWANAVHEPCSFHYCQKKHTCLQHQGPVALNEDSVIQDEWLRHAQPIHQSRLNWWQVKPILDKCTFPLNRPSLSRLDWPWWNSLW